eukprot:gene23-biopygen89
MDPAIPKFDWRGANVAFENRRIRAVIQCAFIASVGGASTRSREACNFPPCISGKGDHRKKQIRETLGSGLGDQEQCWGGVGMMRRRSRVHSICARNGGRRPLTEPRLGYSLEIINSSTMASLFRSVATVGGTGPLRQPAGLIAAPWLQRQQLPLASFAVGRQQMVHFFFSISFFS